MKPLCFVLMPFGRKSDGGGRTIDFDAVYNEIIAPGVTAAGMDVIRADQEQIGGTIHKPMFERLMLCDYAVADMTGANPNVYYELGIRHALRPLGQDLVVMARGFTHDFPDVKNEVVTDPLMEQVAHGIDENLSRFAPTIGNSECVTIFAHDPVPDRASTSLPSEASIFVDVHGLEALGHFHGIAIRAASRDN